MKLKIRKLGRGCRRVPGTLASFEARGRLQTCVLLGHVGTHYTFREEDVYSPEYQPGRWMVFDNDLKASGDLIPT